MALPTLNQLQEAFKIPDAVRIITADQILQKSRPLGQAKEDFHSDNSTFNPDPALSYKSILGTPVYSNIEFLPGSYETNTKGVFKSFGSTVDGPERLRYEAVLITVTQQKLIVKTQIQGRNGSVKEYIGMDDFQVQVNGVIANNNGAYPADAIEAMYAMLEAPISIEVASDFLQIFDIHYLVVDSFQFEEAEGSQSYQKFSISFLSDVQQELELINL